LSATIKEDDQPETSLAAGNTDEMLRSIVLRIEKSKVSSEDKSRMKTVTQNFMQRVKSDMKTG